MAPPIWPPPLFSFDGLLTLFFQSSQKFLKTPNLVVLHSLPCLPLRAVVGYTTALARAVHCSVKIFDSLRCPDVTKMGS